MSNNRPWDFDEARAACRKAAIAQENAEAEVKRAALELALAEEKYRIALAKRIVVLRQEGNAATVCADLARGDESVAALRRLRDIQDGVYEAMKQASWRHNQNRKDAQRFADWSQRREFAETGHAI
jgi:hypothetical protein